MSAILTPLIQPFASTRIDNILPSTTPSDSVVNQPNGFPIDQMLDPTNTSWQAVKEEEVNGTFYFYTKLLYQMGQGYQFTFDAALSSAIGGYPTGAVLYCASNTSYQVSLVPNNTANFVTTPSYINDGVNWQSLTVPIVLYSDNLALAPGGISAFNSNISQTTALGVQALNSINIAGAYICSALTAIGQQTFYSATYGKSSTAIGAFAGGNFPSSLYNTCVGAGSGSGFNNNQNEYITCLGEISGTAGVSNTTWAGMTLLGYNTSVTGSFQNQIGNSFTITYVYGTVQSRSDARDKTEIKEIELGLDFINKLKPRDFKYDYRENYRPEMPTDKGKSIHQYKNELIKYSQDSAIDKLKSDGSKKGKRFHHGFIAQEIEELLQKENIDFGGFQDHKINGGLDVYSIGYTEFIAPMVKAIQELSAQVNKLKQQLGDKNDNANINSSDHSSSRK